MTAEEIADGRTVEIDMNQLENSSLGSPPSGSRSLDEDSSDQGSDRVRIFNTQILHFCNKTSSMPIFV